MPALTFPRSSGPGERPGEGEGRLLNAYLYQDGDASYLRRVPGLAPTGVSRSGGVRCVGAAGGPTYEKLYVVQTGGISVWNGTTWSTLTGNLGGSGRVCMAANIKDPPDVCFAREDAGLGGGVIANTTTYNDFTPGAWLSSVNSVSYLSGYFLWTVPGNGRIYASGVNALTSDTLAFASAEARPDDLIRGIAIDGRFYAMGAETIEPWTNQGKVPFPLSRSQTIINCGLYTWAAVAGDARGWGREVMFVANDGTVRALRGFDAPLVSTAAVERFIADSSKAALEAQVYTVRGDAFWSLTSDAGTWEYNLRTKAWHERQSEGYAGWKATRGAKWQDAWWLYDLDEEAFVTPEADTTDENGTLLTFQVESAPLKEFPLRAAISAVHVDMTRGNGGTFDFSFSLDGGRNWSAWETFSMGTTGEDDGPTVINRLGLQSTHGLRVRVRRSGTLPFSFFGASVPDPVEVLPRRQAQAARDGG